MQCRVVELRLCVAFYLRLGLCMQSCGMPSELDAPEVGGDGYGRMSCDGLMGPNAVYT